MLVWTLIVGFTVDGKVRTSAGFQRAYAAAINQTVTQSSFYDRFTPALGTPLSDLLEHALKEVAAIVIFLASDEASYVNGDAIVVDGDMTAGRNQRLQEVTDSVQEPPTDG